MINECRLCERVQTLVRDRPARLVHEFKSSILVVGDHQFFSGYCVLIFKEHAREIHDLPTEQQRTLSQELLEAGSAVARTFKPWKMNYASLGNQDQHLHWHIMPRYETDPNHKQHPWTDAARFNEFSTTPAMAIEVADRIRKCHTFTS